MRKTLLSAAALWMLGAAAGAAAGAAEPTYTGPKDKLHVFLLIGQSNMAGRAKIEPADAGVIDRAWLFDGKAWVPAQAPFNRYATLRKALGMQRLNCGPSFVRAYLKANPGVSAGIVCWARGGTRIGQWARREDADAKKSLYAAAVAAARAAAKTGTLKGVLWHQGESDCSEAGLAAYPGKIKELVDNLRKDLAAPDLPVVFGQIAPGPAKLPKDRRTLRAAFNKMILEQAAKIPHTACARADDLKTIDGVHFDPPGQRALGNRYAERMLALLKAAK